MPKDTSSTKNDFEKPLEVIKADRRRGPLSEAEFDAEYTKLGIWHGRTTVEAQAKRDQSFSRFYLFSQWTQTRLATKLRLSQATISFTLRFGHFLNYAITGNKVLLSDIGLVCHWLKSDPNSPLTQEKWRTYWLDTDGSDKDRYDRIIQFMRDPNWKSHRGTKTKTTALSTQLVQDENQDLRDEVDRLNQINYELDQRNKNLEKCITDQGQQSNEQETHAAAYTSLLKMGEQHDIEGIAKTIIDMLGLDTANMVADRIKAEWKKAKHKKPK